MRHALPLLILLLLPAVPVGAEVEVHLTGGKVIVVDAAWREGQQVLVERGGRIEAIPATMVVSIGAPKEEKEAPAPASADAPREGPPVVELDDTLLRALQHEQAGRLEEAAAAYREAYERDLASRVAAIGLARVLLAQGQDRAAESALAPVWLDPEPQPQALAILGEIRYREERLEEAVELWERAAERWDDAGLREALVRARRELGAADGYRSAGSAHFRLQHSGEGRSPHERAILAGLEREYTRMSLDFGGGPTQITVILYTERDFRLATEAPGFPPELAAPDGPLALLRRKLALEPSIAGNKKVNK